MLLVLRRASFWRLDRGLPTGSGSVRLWLLALFLVDLVLLAFVPALGRCIHLSARLARLDWRSGGGTARDAIVGCRVELVLIWDFSWFWARIVTPMLTQPLRPKPTLGFQPPGSGPLLLNGHSEKNNQGSPNRIVRAMLKGEATGRVLCATFETIFRSVLI